MDSQEQEDSSSGYFKPSFVLIAIDTAPNMFIKNEEGICPFQICLKACYNITDDLLFVQNKKGWSPFAVVLASDDSQASLVNFNDNMIDSLKLLRNLNEMSYDDLVKTYMRKGSFDLAGFFLFCRKKFKELSSVFYKRTLVYVSNDDDPVQGDKNKRFAALNEVRNFESNELTFQVLPTDEKFDYSVFYNELFTVLKKPNAIEEIVFDEEGLIEKLSSLIIVRFFKRRFKFYPIIGDKSRYTKVIQKNFIKKQKLYNNGFATKNGKLARKVKNSSISKPKEYNLNYGGPTPLQFDAQEHFDIQNNNLPLGYTLIKVAKRQTEFGFILGGSYLLECDPKEDLDFFNTFWQYCVDKNKVLICARKSKFLDKTRFVEFIPKFANNTRLFLIKLLPFADEIYPPSLKFIDVDDFSEEQYEVTTQLMDSLTFDYSSDMFSNISFVKKRAFIKAKLLNQPLVEVEDVTLDPQGVDEQIGEVADRFASLLGAGAMEAAGRKRKGAATKSRVKKIKD